MDDDELDGCDLNFRVEPTDDNDIDGVVLFAGVPEEQVEAKKAEWEALFGGS